jgi:hypothetical protein
MKERKVWVLEISWNFDDDHDSDIYLFSSLIKAQTKMSECIKEDFSCSCLTRFEYFEYKDFDNDYIRNKVPYEIFINEPIKSKYAMLYSDYSSDYISYEITRKSIK